MNHRRSTPRLSAGIHPSKRFASINPNTNDSKFQDPRLDKVDGSYANI